jgi:chromosome segregation ATPase
MAGGRECDVEQEKLNEERREELRKRLQEREDTVKELLEQLEIEREKLDDAREELKTLPRPLVWEPLKGRIGLLEGRVNALVEDLARARLALLEERQAQARAVHEETAAEAAEAHQAAEAAMQKLKAAREEREELERTLSDLLSRDRAAGGMAASDREDDLPDEDARQSVG